MLYFVQSLFDLSGAPLRYDDRLANKFIQVATVSFQSSAEKMDNIAKIASYSTKILSIHPDTELILFPHCFLHKAIFLHDGI
jgi:hypothetical protein